MDERLRYLFKINRNLELYKRKKAQIYNLNATYSLAIHLICKNKGISQDELADKLGVDKGLVTKISKYLESEGYIRRIKDQHDRRVNRLLPTEKAEGVQQDVIAIERYYFKELFLEFTSEEYDIFMNLLERLYIKSKNLRKSANHEELS